MQFKVTGQAVDVLLSSTKDIFHFPFSETLAVEIQSSPEAPQAVSETHSYNTEVCDTLSSSFKRSPHGPDLICLVTSYIVSPDVSGRHPRRKPLSPSKLVAPVGRDPASAASHCLSSPLCLFALSCRWVAQMWPAPARQGKCRSTSVVPTGSGGRWWWRDIKQGEVSACDTSTRRLSCSWWRVQRKSPTRLYHVEFDMMCLLSLYPADSRGSRQLEGAWYLLSEPTALSLWQIKDRLVSIKENAVNGLLTRGEPDIFLFKHGFLANCS